VEIDNDTCDLCGAKAAPVALLRAVPSQPFLAVCKDCLDDASRALDTDDGRHLDPLPEPPAGGLAPPPSSTSATPATR